jgi:LmbE family N-acetylglucosaminyl deacetylase
MHRLASLALATLLAASAPAFLYAQTSPFTDPANLRGERVSPRTGRELPIDGGNANNVLGLQQLLRKLSTRASILNIVAHPDDEDGGMLTLYSRGYGARVADLSLTRGEGGQNAMTGDFEDALGLLRTQELLSNDRYTGVTQMFGTEVDFGFSKTKEESFSKWGHDRVLYDAVRAIRLFRPLVITATFIGNPTDGHGQHQVSGQIAQEAFKAAGDPNIFPELTKEGILPWQPLKMYARVPMQAISSKGLFDYATGQYVPARFTNYVTGVTSTTPPTPDITIHEGTPDPLLTTCAANPSDLPNSLRSANSSSSSRDPLLLSSRDSLPLSSFRTAGGSASSPADCRPLSYVQFARIGLGLQRSQIGPGVRNARSGAFDVPYHLYGSRICASSKPSALPQNCHPERSAQRAVEGPATPPVRTLPLDPSSLQSQPSFFSGIDTSIAGIASLAPQAPAAFREQLLQLQTQINQLVSGFDAAHPSNSAAPLGEALDKTNALIRQLESFSLPPAQIDSVRHELRVKQVQLNDALELALGLSFDVTSPAADLPTEAPVKLTSRITEKASIDLSVDEVRADTPSGGQTVPAEDKRADRPLSADHADQRTLTLPASETLTITRPYFYRDNIEHPVYQLRSAALRNAPAAPAALIAWATIDYRGTRLTLGRIVHAGQQPARFVPPFSLSLSDHAQVLPSSSHSLTLSTTVRPTSDSPLKGVLLLTAPAGWKVEPAKSPLHSGATAFAVQIPSARDLATLAAVAHTINGDHVTEGFRPVGYGDLPRTNVYTPATDRIVPVDLKLPPENKRHIAYLPGTGDDVPAALASIGLQPTLLTVADLTPAKLANFDTVILGVRTYNAHPDLHGAPTQALLNFARSGGNVLVQYQTYEFTAADAPFPLELGRAEKVVDETVPVELLHTDSTLLTTPNHIQTTDFDHWIEERGHGFLGSWDPHYTPLTETHDLGQAPQKGGLITVRLGRGRWTYCAFALYRQLPEAIPGAYRLFVDLLTP